MDAARLDNMEIVRRAIEAEDNHDNAQIAELYAAKLVIHALYDSYNHVKDEQVGYDFESTQEDSDALSAHDLEEFPQTRTTIDEIFEAADNKVVTITTATSTHRSGKEVTFKSVNIERIADGKIVEGWYSWDRLGYWQQLGFVPPTRELVAQLENR